MDQTVQNTCQNEKATQTNPQSIFDNSSNRLLPVPIKVYHLIDQKNQKIPLVCQSLLQNNNQVYLCTNSTQVIQNLVKLGLKLCPKNHDGIYLNQNYRLLQNQKNNNQIRTESYKQETISQRLKRQFAKFQDHIYNLENYSKEVMFRYLDNSEPAILIYRDIERKCRFMKQQSEVLNAIKTQRHIREYMEKRIDIAKKIFHCVRSHKNGWPMKKVYYFMKSQISCLLFDAQKKQVSMIQLYRETNKIISTVICEFDLQKTGRQFQIINDQQTSAQLQEIQNNQQQKKNEEYHENRTIKQFLQNKNQDSKQINLRSNHITQQCQIQHQSQKINKSNLQPRKTSYIKKDQQNEKKPSPNKKKLKETNSKGIVKENIIEQQPISSDRRNESKAQNNILQ